MELLIKRIILTVLVSCSFIAFIFFFPKTHDHISKKRLEMVERCMETGLTYAECEAYTLSAYKQPDFGDLTKTHIEHICKIILDKPDFGDLTKTHIATHKKNNKD